MGGGGIMAGIGSHNPVLIVYARDDIVIAVAVVLGAQDGFEDRVAALLTAGEFIFVHTTGRGLPGDDNAEGDESDDDSSEETPSQPQLVGTRVGNQVTEIVIGDEVTTIGRNAFSGYKELTSLTISKNVTKIGQSAFATYIKIANLICRAVSPPLCDSHALDGIYKSYCTLIVPQGSLAAYQSADQWKDFYIIEEGTNRIKNNGVESKIVHIYDAKGHKVENLQRGMNIVKTSDGTTKKILVK